MRKHDKPIMAATLALSAGLAITSADAQRFQRLLGTSGSEFAHSVIELREGGYATAGFRAQTPTGFDFHIVRYDPFGNRMWEQIWGGGGRDVAYGIAETRDGGFVVVGESQSFQNGLETILLRLDPAGNGIWAFAYTGSAQTDAVNFPQPGRKLALGPNDEVAFTGNLGGQPMVHFTDPFGNLISQGIYVVPLGPARFDMGFTDIEVDVDGPVPRLLVSGTVLIQEETPGGMRRDYDAILMQTDFGGFPTGPLMLYETPVAPNAFESGDGLDLLPGGEIILGGRTNFGIPGDAGNFLMLLDPMGFPLWANSYRHIDPDGNLARVNTAYASTEYDHYRNVIAQAGDLEWRDEFNAHLMVTDLNGRALFSRAYGQQFLTSAEAMKPARDCGYIMAGLYNKQNNMEPGFGGTDVYLVKTNNIGDALCLQTRLEPHPDMPLRPLELPVIVDPFGGFIEMPPMTRQVASGEFIFCEDPTCGPCNFADFELPYDVLNIDDVLAYLDAFAMGDPRGDIAVPYGVLNIDDVLFFLDQFAMGCP